MKLNLGCGDDLRDGYENVDARDIHGRNRIVDLDVLPWPWSDGSVEEILMLDFLEHFEYSKTDQIVLECWRVLRPMGVVEVQVPDFEHCAAALVGKHDTYLCNACGNLCSMELACNVCGRTHLEIASSAVARLYGGQDYAGNYHKTTFTKKTLETKFRQLGFGSIEFLVTNEHGESYSQNWSIKMRARKEDDLWT